MLMGKITRVRAKWQESCSFRVSETRNNKNSTSFLLSLSALFAELPYSHSPTDGVSEETLVPLLFEARGAAAAPLRFHQLFRLESMAASLTDRAPTLAIASAPASAPTPPAGAGVFRFSFSPPTSRCLVLPLTCLFDGENFPRQNSYMAKGTSCGRFFLQVNFWIQRGQLAGLLSER